MMSLKYRIIVVVLALLIGACTSKTNKKTRTESMLFTSGGRTSELLVVMADQNWEKSAGDTIRKTLGDVPPWMAQNEPEYRIAQIAKHQFGPVFQKFRNILIVEFDTSLSKSKVSVRHNVWAQPQTIAKIQSPNLKSFMDAYTQSYKKIKAYYHKNEITRIMDAYRGLQERRVSIAVEKKFGFNMIFPKGFFVAVDGPDFIWVRRPTTEVEEGVIIYTYPYSDTSNFNYKNIIALRDSLTKRYIPGPVEGSYMKVSSFFPPYHIRTKFKGNYATEIRSLWDVHGYAMGGPFMSYNFVDTLANRMIMIDGYIKAPRKDKRDLMLHIEAIFGSFKFVDSPAIKQN